MFVVQRWNKNILHGGILLNQGEILHDAAEALIAHPASHGVMRLTVLCLTAQISPEPGVTTISIRLGVGSLFPRGGAATATISP